MNAAVLRRLLAAAGLLFAVSVAGFALLRLMPGDVAEVLLMAQMDGEVPSSQALAAPTCAWLGSKAIAMVDPPSRNSAMVSFTPRP